MIPVLRRPCGLQCLRGLALLLCLLAACAFPAAAGETNAPPLPPGLICGDFLAMAGKKPQALEFLGCAEGREHQLRALIANYRVRGADAALAHDSLRRDVGLPPLVFACCRWETAHGGQGRFSFRQPGLPAARAAADDGLLTRYSVRMGSGDTLRYEREEWLLIPWFYVNVTLNLETP